MKSLAEWEEKWKTEVIFDYNWILSTSLPHFEGVFNASQSWRPLSHCSSEKQILYDKNAATE